MRALALLQDSAPKAAGDTDRIVVATKQGKLTDPPTKQRIAQMLARVRTLPHVASIGTPTISPNGQIGFVSFNFDEQANKLDLAAIKRVINTAKAAETPRFGSSSAVRPSRTRTRRARAAPLPASLRRRSCCSSCSERSW